MQRLVDGILQFRERDDRRHALEDELPGQAEQHPAEDCVLAACEAGQETRLQRQQGGAAAESFHLAPVGTDDSREQAQQRAFPRAVSPDHAEGLAMEKRKTDVLERPELLPAKESVASLVADPDVAQPECVAFLVFTIGVHAQSPSLG